MVPMKSPVQTAMFDYSHQIFNWQANNQRTTAWHYFANRKWLDGRGSVKGDFRYYNGTTYSTLGPFAGNLAHINNATSNYGVVSLAGWFLSSTSTTSTLFCVAAWDGVSTTPTNCFAAYGDWYTNSSNVRQNSIAIEMAGSSILGSNVSSYSTGVAMPVNRWVPAVMTRSGTSCVMYYHDNSQESWTASASFGFKDGCAMNGSGTGSRRAGMATALMIGSQGIAPLGVIRQFILNPFECLIPT
jgi:hypothetical protein